MVPSTTSKACNRAAIIPVVQQSEATRLPHDHHPRGKNAEVLTVPCSTVWKISFRLPVVNSEQCWIFCFNPGFGAPTVGQTSSGTVK